MSRHKKLFLSVGPLLVLSWLSLIFVEARGSLSVGYLAGSLFAHPTLAAAWSAFGPGPPNTRLLLSFIWMILLPIAVGINQGFHLVDAVVFGICSFGQWLVLHVPFLALAFDYGWRLHDLDTVRQPSSVPQFRFGIRHLVIIMAIIGLVLPVGRIVLPEVILNPLVFLSIAAIIVTLPLLLTALMRRKALLGVLLSLLLITIATVIVKVLFESLGGSGVSLELFIAANATSAILTLLVTGAARLNGYRLRRGPRPGF